MPRPESMRYVTILLMVLATGCSGENGDPDGGKTDAAVDGGDGGEDAGPTWYADVLPIVHRRCWSCHADDGVGAFSMEDFAEVRPWAASIAAVVQNGYMPPWLPSEGCQPMVDERRVTPGEIDLIERWNVAGALEGDSAGAPSAPVAPALPRVDASVPMAEAYTPVAPDDQRCFVIDPGLLQDEQLVGFQLIPGVRGQILAATIFVADPLDAIAADNADPGVGWGCYGRPQIGNGEPVGAWAPGIRGIFPEGTGVLLPAGQVLVLRIHYDPKDPAVADQSTVTLMYADTPVKSAFMFPLLENTFTIDPNDLMARTEGSLGPLTTGASLHGVFPQMHGKGTSLRVWIEKADTREVCLLDIPRWAFEWHGLFYVDLPGGIAVEAGDTLRVACSWANRTSNTIGWGESADDEKCLSYVYATTP